MANYLEFNNIVDFNSANIRFFTELGYDSKVQTDTKTSEYASLILHPSNGKVLMIMKDVTVHGKTGDKENPETNIISSEEKVRVKTREEWKLEGYFPEFDIDGNPIL